MNTNNDSEPTEPDPTLDPTIAEALIMPDDKIEYPDNETWDNLGHVILAKAESAEQSERRNAPMPFPLKAVWWAAAAAAVVALMIDFWPQQASNTILVTDNQPPKIETEWVEVAGFPSLADEDLAALDALEWQAELDILLLDLEAAGIVDRDDEEAVNALLEGYGIDTGDLVASYVDQF